MPVVNFAEALSIRVGRFLREEYPNIAFADNCGKSITELTNEVSIGLLDAYSAPQLSWWQKIFVYRTRRRFMGVLWFSNEKRCATNKNWIIELYGDQDVKFLTEIAQRLSVEFEANIHLKLITEKPREETFLSDFAM